MIVCSPSDRATDAQQLAHDYVQHGSNAHVLSLHGGHRAKAGTLHTRIDLGGGVAYLGICVG